MSFKASIFNHLEELRQRLILIFIIYGIFVLLSYFFIDELLNILQKPVGKLIYIAPAELFFTRIKLSLFSAVVILFPFFLVQVRAYILPAIDYRNKKNLDTILSISGLLFYSAIFISYKLFLPYTMRFLLKFSSSEVVPMLTVSKYISFLILFFLSFILILQIPIAILFLTRTGMVSLRSLRRQRRYIYVLSFVIAAILTPPDVFSQIILALPMIILFELSILISRISRYNKISK